MNTHRVQVLIAIMTNLRRIEPILIIQISNCAILRESDEFSSILSKDSLGRTIHVPFSSIFQGILL